MGKSLSFEIIGCAMKVYNHLGPGLLESAYEIALKYELEKKRFQSRHSGSSTFQI